MGNSAGYKPAAPPAATLLGTHLSLCAKTPPAPKMGIPGTVYTDPGASVTPSSPKLVISEKDSFLHYDGTRAGRETVYQGEHPFGQKLCLLTVSDIA